MFIGVAEVVTAPNGMLQTIDFFGIELYFLARILSNQLIPDRTTAIP